jgi:proteasome lid subunit RPN8/RPN11
MVAFADNAFRPCSTSRNRSFVSSKTHTPWGRLQVSGLRYYSPELGRWPSRDPIGDICFLRAHFRRKYGVSVGSLRGPGRSLYSHRELARMRSRLWTEAMAPVYLFAGNAAVSWVDVLGLASTASQTAIDAVGEEYSNKASLLASGPFAFEACGIICSKGDEVEATKPHTSQRSCRCKPRLRPKTGRMVSPEWLTCKGKFGAGWVLVAGYHSHPDGSTVFGTLDRNWANTVRVPLYVGGSNVRVIDKDGNERTL